MNKSKKLNAGCGKDIKKGYINLDSAKLPGVDVVHNLDKYPWPFRENSFDEVYCDNVLEHLGSITKPAEEIWRISRNHAKVIVKVPIFPSNYAAADPTHKQFFTYTTFNYFRPEDRLNYYSKARFKIKNRKIVFHPYLKLMTLFFNSSELIQKVWNTFLYSLFPAQFIHFELEVLK